MEHLEPEPDTPNPTTGNELAAIVARALAEDVGDGDVTAAAAVPEGARGRARIVQKQPGVLFGWEAVREALRQCGVGEFDPLLVEGQWRDEVPAQVATAVGPAAGLLAAERTALNLLGHLSGVATLTARFVEAVAGTGVRILDTRKTTPGLRALEKAAVAAGGGTNHRMGLHDAILLKENYITLAGGIEAALARATNRTGGEDQPSPAVEVECRNLDEVERAAAAGADRILLDNMSPAEMRQAVSMRGASETPQLEASGGATLENAREIAETGVEFVSVGALTHSAAALDLSMLVDPV